MGERLPVISSADKGAVVVSDVLVLSLSLIFFGFFLTSTSVSQKRDHDKTEAWESADGGGGGHH